MSLLVTLNILSLLLTLSMYFFAGGGIKDIFMKFFQTFKSAIKDLDIGFPAIKIHFVILEKTLAIKIRFHILEKTLAKNLRKILAAD